MSNSLTGKVALVTGGSRGIGSAIVRRLTEEGAQVAFTYGRSKEAAEKLATDMGGKTKAYPADANNLTVFPQLVAGVLKDYGKIDILVNNAGMGNEGVIGEITLADYQQGMRVNVDALFVLTNEVVKTMAAGSRIINISSILGERAIFPGISTYNTSKFAVIGQTRSWALDLGARNILVNAVLPGPVDTDMNPANGPSADTMRSLTALGRFGRPEEIAGAVAFLAGPDASFITGATLRVDGGANA